MCWCANPLTPSQCSTVFQRRLKVLSDAQMEGVEPCGKMFDAKVKVMGQFVKHHGNEE